MIFIVIIIFLMLTIALVLGKQAVNKKICIPHLDLKDFARLIGKLKCVSVYNIIKIYACKNYLWSDVIDSFKTVPYEQF